MPFALFLPLIPIAALCVVGLPYLVPFYRTPEEIPYWVLLFGLPHIVSSLQTACDRDYLAFYRGRAVLALLLLLLPFTLFQAGVSAVAIYTAYFVLTVHHVVCQQYGIALSVAGLRPSVVSMTCKTALIALGIVAYAWSYYAPDLGEANPYATAISWARACAPPLLAIAIISGGMLVWRARNNRVGAVLLGVNLALFVSGLVMILGTPLGLVGLMLIRVLHDVTGFVTYIEHDRQRDRHGRRNFLYRLMPWLPVWLLNPLFAITIAAALTYAARGAGAIQWIVIGITLVHYYTEGFFWRRGTPHRREFNIAGP